MRKAGRLNYGEAGSDWVTFRLSRAEYADFESRLRGDEALWGWYVDKVRYDWEPEEGRGRYVLRMPTAVHEIFTLKVEDGVAAGITTLADRLGESGKEDDGKVAEELKKIYKGRHTTLELRVPKLENSSQESAADSNTEETVVKGSPDATFYHPSQAELPCLVLEVSYSQQQKYLPRLAESYIIDSQHAIRCVVGLDITYQSHGKKKENKVDKSATVSQSGRLRVSPKSCDL